jgi:uncharacterized membrane protein YdjX (TVP38/TMEM64 family)
MSEAIKPPRNRYVRLGLLALGAAVIGAFFWYGPREGDVLQHQHDLKTWVNERWWSAWLLFIVVEILLVLFSLPVATVCSILAGFMFGTWYGTVAVSIASTTGAFGAMMTSRYLFRRSMRRRLERFPRAQGMMNAIDRGLSKDGWLFMLIVRMTPLFPFFLLNIAIGLSKVRWSTYWWTTQLGMLPMTFVVVSTAASFSTIETFHEVLDWKKLWPLSLLVLIPIAIKLATKSYFAKLNRLTDHGMDELG